MRPRSCQGRAVALSRRSGQTAFSLIEVMIVVLVVAILAAVALPSYRDHVRKNQRRDAITVLGQIQLAQERRRASQAGYGTLAEIGISAQSPDGHYVISLTNVTATTYAAAATATGDQASDSGCASFSVTQDGPDMSTPQKRDCWGQ